MPRNISPSSTVRLNLQNKKRLLFRRPFPPSPLPHSVSPTRPRRCWRAMNAIEDVFADAPCRGRLWSTRRGRFSGLSETFLVWWGVIFLEIVVIVFRLGRGSWTCSLDPCAFRRYFYHGALCWGTRTLRGLRCGGRTLGIKGYSSCIGLWIKDTPLWSGGWFWLSRDRRTAEHFFKVLGGGDVVLVGLGFISVGLKEGWGGSAEVLGCPTFGFFGAAVLSQELGGPVDSKPPFKIVVIVLG
jgi:hypothetical protein